MAAVTIARNAIPSSITNAPTSLPVGFFGVTSPYPTVVTVCSAHHMPSQMLEDVVASLAGRFLAPDWLAATAGPSS